MKARSTLRKKNRLYEGYFIKNPFANSIVRLADWIISFLVFCKSTPPKNSPSKILIVQPNHLGDVVIASAILDPLQRLFPDAAISFLTGSWNLQIINKDNRFHKIHCFDHFRMNRSKHSKLKKLWVHLQTFLKAALELKKERYDLALVLSPYWGNGIPITFLSSIKWRVGFKTGGFKGLLNVALNFEEDWHITRGYKAILDSISGGDFSEDFIPKLAGASKDLVPKSLVGQKWIVIQIGAGESYRLWDEKKWRLLIKGLETLGYALAFTGYGKQEEADIKSVTRGVSNCINLCNQLSWQEFLSVMSDADLFVGLDSGAAHVASAFQVPSIVIANSSAESMNRFKPLTPKLEVIYFTRKGASKNGSTSDVQEHDSPDYVLFVCMKLLGKRNELSSSPIS